MSRPPHQTPQEVRDGSTAKPSAQSGRRRTTLGISVDPGSTLTVNRNAVWPIVALAPGRRGSTSPREPRLADQGAVVERSPQRPGTQATGGIAVQDGGDQRAAVELRRRAVARAVLRAGEAVVGRPAGGGGPRPRPGAGEAGGGQPGGAGPPPRAALCRAAPRRRPASSPTWWVPRAPARARPR